MARKVLIAVSGTGGHVYPGIALAEELTARRPDVRVLFAAAHGKPGAAWIRSAGYDVVTVPLRGFSRRPGIRWIVFPFALLAGAFKTLYLLLRQAPNLVVGTGGYVAGPFVAFASLLRIPTMVLEQNNIPGATTRLASLFVRQVHVAFAETVQRLPRKGRAVVSGNPVRRSVQEGNAADFRAEHGLGPQQRLVLVVGGSQGAQSLTAAALEASRELCPGREDLAFVVQVGRFGVDALEEQQAGAPPCVRLVPFLERIGDAYAAAELVVGRAGAMTLAELAAAGVPALLVPYPHAAEDHQRVNARRYAEQGAAVVLDPEELSGPRLAEAIRELIDDEGARQRMASAARRSAGHDARERIADACETILEAS